MGSEFCHEQCPFAAVLTPDLYWTWAFRWEPTHKDPYSHNCNVIVTTLAVRTSVVNVFISDHAVGTELVTWTDWFIIWLDIVFWTIDWPFYEPFLYLVPSYMLPSLNIISSHLTPQIYAILSRWLETELRHAALSRESDFRDGFHLLILLERGPDRQKRKSQVIQFSPHTYTHSRNECG